MRRSSDGVSGEVAVARFCVASLIRGRNRSPCSVVVNLLPESPYRVLADRSVRGNESQTVFDRLAHQHAVERVLVQTWQTRQVQRAPLVERETSEAMAMALARHECFRRFRQRQPAQPMLQRDFPGRQGAHKYLVRRRRNRSPDRGRHGLRGCHPPEEDRGVEQEPHSLPPSKAAISSSGSGSKKEGGTVNVPLPKPKGRGSSAVCGSGRISATGRFRRHRMIVSPADTRST